MGRTGTPMSVTKTVQASLADFELGEEVAWGSLATVKSSCLSLSEPGLLIDGYYRF